MVRNEAPNVVMTLDSGADGAILHCGATWSSTFHLHDGCPGRSYQKCRKQTASTAGLHPYRRDGGVCGAVRIGCGCDTPIDELWTIAQTRMGAFSWQPRTLRGAQGEGPEDSGSLERNSLAMDVRVCAVRAEDNETQEMEAMALNDKDSQEIAKRKPIQWREE